MISQQQLRWSLLPKFEYSLCTSICIYIFLPIHIFRANIHLVFFFFFLIGDVYFLNEYLSCVKISSKISAEKFSQNFSTLVVLREKLKKSKKIQKKKFLCYYFKKSIQTLKKKMFFAEFFKQMQKKRIIYEVNLIISICFIILAVSNRIG